MVWVDIFPMQLRHTHKSRQLHWDGASHNRHQLPSKAISQTGPQANSIKVLLQLSFPKITLGYVKLTTIVYIVVRLLCFLSIRPLLVRRMLQNRKFQMCSNFNFRCLAIKLVIVYPLSSSGMQILWWVLLMSLTQFRIEEVGLVRDCLDSTSL